MKRTKRIAWIVVLLLVIGTRLPAQELGVRFTVQSEKVTIPAHYNEVGSAVLGVALVGYLVEAFEESMPLDLICTTGFRVDLKTGCIIFAVTPEPGYLLVTTVVIAPDEEGVTEKATEVAAAMVKILVSWAGRENALDLALEE